MNGLNLDLFLRLIQTDFAAWAVLGLLILGLSIAVWAGVGSQKALRKCLILSIVAHVFLVRYGQPAQWARSGMGLLGDDAQSSFPDQPPPPAGIRSLEILDLQSLNNLTGSGEKSLGTGSGNGSGGIRNGILPNEIAEALPEIASELKRPQSRPEIPPPQIALNDRLKQDLPDLPEAPLATTLPIQAPQPENRPTADLTPSDTKTETTPLSTPAAVTEQEQSNSISPAAKPSVRVPLAPLPTPADVARRPTGNRAIYTAPTEPLTRKSAVARPEVALPAIDIASTLLPAPSNRPVPESRPTNSNTKPPLSGLVIAPPGPAEDLAPPVPALERQPSENAKSLGPGSVAITTRSNPINTLPDQDLRSRIRRTPTPKEKLEVAANTPKPKSAIELPKPNLAELGGPSLLSDRRNRPSNRVMADVPLVYRSRLDPDRARLAIKAGASAESEKAVEMALEWLSKHQDSDGRWDGGVAKYRDGSVAPEEDSFTVHCPPGDICFGECYYWEADTALTGLSLLAYLGAGYTHTEGKHADTVARGLDYLIRSQKPDGDLRGRSVAVGMYCHAMASLALCEAFALTGDERLKTPVTNAIDFLVKAQAENGAAWRYEPRAPVGDTSILGWVVLALRSGRSLGMNVPQKSITGIQAWLDAVSEGKSGGLAKYQPWKEVTPTMTAEAWLCRWFLNLDPGVKRSQEAANYLLEHGPDRDPYNLYYWYYGTLSMYQQGGQDWEKWNSLVRDRIVQKQQTKGHKLGSWDPDDSQWGTYGGRVYCTALATLTLEVYYRFLRLYEEPKSGFELRKSQ